MVRYSLILRLSIFLFLGQFLKTQFPLEYMLSVDGPNMKDSSLSNIIHLIAIDSSMFSQSRDLKADVRYALN